MIKREEGQLLGDEPEERKNEMNGLKRNDRNLFMNDKPTQKTEREEEERKSQEMEVGPEVDEVWSSDGPSYAL